MKIYSHRGNLTGPDSEENEPSYIEAAINAGFHVEVDIWKIGEKWYLGHDYPKYEIDNGWILLFADYVLFHCKNAQALFSLSQFDFDIHYFWHQSDDYTMTNKGYIVGYPGTEYCEKSIVHENDKNKVSNIVFGVLTDYAERFQK